MGEFVMPSLGADMAAGTLYEWCVKPGDTVARGDVIAEVETDKGVIEVEVWEDGTVGELLVEPGTEVPVGTVLAIILGEGEAPAKQAQAEPEPAPAAAEAGPEPQQPLRAITPAAPSHNGGRLRVSPVARRRAQELDIDLHELEGTGPGGAITLDDVEQAAKAPVPEPEARVRVSPVARRMAEELGVDLTKVEGTGPSGCISKADVERAAAAMASTRPVPTPAQAAPEQQAPPAPPKPETPQRAEPDFQAGMRRAIAAAMARANREIPHYYLETHIDMSHPLAWLEAENANRSVRDRLLPVVLLIKGVAKALTEVPQLNAYWVEDRHQIQEAVHIGFAIALRQGGLVTPAIHHADLKSLDELMEVMRDLIKRTRAGRLRSSEMTDPTITLTNLGDMGVEKVYGVIYPPQVALVGFGKIAEQPWAINGMLGVRPIVTATLAGDHRATDGRTGAQFLDALNKHLQEPEEL